MTLNQNSWLSILRVGETGKETVKLRKICSGYSLTSQTVTVKDCWIRVKNWPFVYVERGYQIPTYKLAKSFNLQIWKSDHFKFGPIKSGSPILQINLVNSVSFKSISLRKFLEKFSTASADVIDLNRFVLIGNSIFARFWSSRPSQFQVGPSNTTALGFQML